MPVLFTNTIEFLVNAVYIGGIPMAEHHNLKRGNARTTGAATGNTALGEANERNISVNDTCT